MVNYYDDLPGLVLDIPGLVLDLSGFVLDPPSLVLDPRLFKPECPKEYIILESVFLFTDLSFAC